MAVDNEKLMEFIEQFAGDLGATMAAGSVVIGHRLGLYRALAEGPATAEQLAERTDCNPRYLAEWLRGQAAGGYISYDPATQTFAMTEEQAFALADPDGPVYLPGAFVLALGALEGRAADHRGLPHRRRVRLARAGRRRVQRLRAVLPPRLRGEPRAQLDPGARRSRGEASGRRASRRCRVRARLLDRAHGAGIPRLDDHRLGLPRRVDRAQARKRAADAGVANRTSFEVASAQTFTGSAYDLVTTFDCLHDMGDPVGAARHVREALTPDGTWLIVEPAAADTVEGNLNPVGRIYYSASTFLCVPNGLSQPGGYALGAQAGEAAIRQVVTDAGFTRFRRVAETPFNVVYQVVP